MSLLLSVKAWVKWFAHAVTQCYVPGVVGVLTTHQGNSTKCHRETEMANRLGKKNVNVAMEQNELPVNNHKEYRLTRDMVLCEFCKF